MLELLELLDELLDSDVSLDALLELLDTLEALLTLELLELELLDRSSIDRIHKRSPDDGPGNCNDPVWKLRISGVLTSPVDFVSINTACQIVLSARLTTTLVAAAPASASWVAAGTVSSPAFIIREMVNCLVANPTAMPKPNVTFFDIICLHKNKKSCDGIYLYPSQLLFGTPRCVSLVPINI